MTSVEAYIYDHKEQRSLLLVHSTLEANNKLLHDYSSDANIGYKDINAQLDRYTHAFDVIDILYQTLRTSLNVYNTYETASERLGDYKDMLEDFNKKCLEQGNIVSTDTLIITINARALAKIADEGDNLYKSVSDLVLYATGAAACSTSDLILVLSSINQSLDNITKHLNKAYFDTWKYIQVRIRYWERQVYRVKTKQEIIEGALGRWKGVGNRRYQFITDLKSSLYVKTHNLFQTNNILINAFQTNINRIVGAGGFIHDKDRWNDYYHIFQCAIKATQDAYMPNAQRKKEYLAIYADITKQNETLIAYLVQFNKKAKTADLLLQNTANQPIVLLLLQQLTIVGEMTDGEIMEVTPIVVQILMA